jgi:hypothetical protein
MPMTLKLREELLKKAYTLDEKPNDENHQTYRYGFFVTVTIPKEFREAKASIGKYMQQLLSSTSELSKTHIIFNVWG